jgi:hypothetical protein
MATEPDTFPSWATDGGAEITDPGVSKRATGFVTAEAPAAGHMNHQLNAVGEFLEYLADSLAPFSLVNNLDRTANQPWTSFSANRYCCQYNEFNGTWNMLTFLTSGGVVTAYSSTTGDHGTWTSTAITSGATGITGMAEDTTDGTIYVGIDENIWSASDGDCQSLTDSTVNFASITDTATADMVYDDVNDLLIASGLAGTTTHIETASPGGAWTSRHNVATTTPNCLVTGRGTTFFHSTATTSTKNLWSSDPTVTWTAFTPNEIFIKGMYVPDQDLFVFAGNAAHEIRVPGSASAIVRTGEEVSFLASSSTIGFTVNAYDSATDPELVTVYGGSANRSNSTCTMARPRLLGISFTAATARSYGPAQPVT